MPFEHTPPEHLSAHEAEDRALHSAIHHTDPHNNDLHSATRLSEHQVIHAYRDIGVELADMREEHLASRPVRFYTLNNYGVNDGRQQ